MKATLLNLFVALLLGFNFQECRASDEVDFLDWLRAARKVNIPVSVLYAIAQKESGRQQGKQLVPYPLALNVKGAAVYPDTRSEAEGKLRLIEANRIRDVDVGMMQINLRYNGNRVADPKQLLDPLTNLQVAVDVLLDCKTRATKLEDILACYHSGDSDEKGYQYAADVINFAIKPNPHLGIAGYENGSAPLIIQPKKKVEPFLIDKPAMKAEGLLLLILKSNVEEVSNDKPVEIRIL